MLVEIEAGETARVVRMNSGENRFNQEFVDAMNLTLTEVEKDGAARAVVLTGAQEKYFSNGLDLNWIVAQKKEAILKCLLSVNELLLRVLVFPKPVVAAINGHAFAGGLLLACAADYRVMRADRGWCCFPEVELGIDFPPGSVGLVKQAIGDRKADSLILSGKKLTAPEALAIGLIDETAAADALLPRALAVASDLGRQKAARQYGNLKLNLRSRLARVMTEQDPPYIQGKLEGAQK